MQFLRLGAIGHEIPVVRSHDNYFSLLSLTRDIDGDFWISDGPARVAQALQQGDLPELMDAAILRIGAPVARPQAVVCVGLNYAAHAAESNQPAPEHPVIFFKHPNTIVGPNDGVPMPHGATTMDWEVELAIIVSAKASYLPSVGSASRHIAGYCLANDVSERNNQLLRSGSQWGKGKSSPSFLPLGPTLVSADEIDPSSLTIRSWVNGEIRQDSLTRDMIFSVNEIMHDLSQYMTLEPGDVILTGTPEGVALSGRFPYLKPGDQMEMEIGKLGRQRQTVI